MSNTQYYFQPTTVLATIKAIQQLSMGAPLEDNSVAFEQLSSTEYDVSYATEEGVYGLEAKYMEDDRYAHINISKYVAIDLLDSDGDVIEEFVLDVQTNTLINEEGMHLQVEA